MEYEIIREANRIIFFLEPPVIDIKEVGKRVLPLNSVTKFYDIIKYHRNFVGLDDSHFWVSGNYEICFKTEPGQTIKSLEKFLLKCVTESGGFMSSSTWKRRHNKSKKNIIWLGATSTKNIEFR